MFRTTDTHVYFLGGYFSQWAHTPFSAPLPQLRPTSSGAKLSKVGTLRFSHAEQYMMASKAMVFNDQDTMLEIMDSKHPGDQKKLGRKVKNFQPEVWEAVCRPVVYLGNWYKFVQHEGARKFLEEHRGKKFVEGADYDPIWGVGISWDDPLIEDEANWKGTNYLGEVIMKVDSDLVAHGESADPWQMMKLGWT